MERAIEIGLSFKRFRCRSSSVEKNHNSERWDSLETTDQRKRHGARAIIDWAISRDVANGGEFLAVNVGSDEWNYQVKDLAQAVAKVIPGVDVSINNWMICILEVKPPGKCGKIMGDKAGVRGPRGQGSE